MTAKQAKFYIPSLDGIRAIAFLIVFLSHAGFGKYVPGGFGVTIFFFLSGYLITTMLRREHERSNRIDFKKFYMRRVLRIWPPFYLVLFLAVVVSWLVGTYSEPEFSGHYLQAFLTQFFHYSNYYNIEYGNQYMALGTEVYWSLAVEEHFYLLFPLLYVLLRKLGIGSSKQATIFWSICLLVLLWRCLLVFTMGADYDRIFFATDTRVDSILFGCALAVAGNPAIEQDRQLSERNLKYILLPIGCVFILGSLLIRTDAFRDTLRYTIQGVALYPIFIAAIRFPDWFVFKPLNWGWMRFVGVLSYSLYLVHFMVIKALITVMPELGLIGTAVLSMLISVAISYAVYRFAEVPAAKLKKKFSSH
jgi:peptidoglycan/LPS O-acetylase OafA/YrhL